MRKSEDSRGSNLMSCDSQGGTRYQAETGIDNVGVSVSETVESPESTVHRASDDSAPGTSRSSEWKAAEAETVSYHGLDLNEISRLRHWKNQLFLSVAFFLNYTAYSSIQNLQSTINTEGALGLTSLILIYGFLIISGFAAPFVIGLFGAKWTLVFATTIYAFYSYVNTFQLYYPIVITSALLGLSGSPLWVSQATYLTRSAYQLAGLVGLPEELIINRMNGLFYIHYYAASIVGNLMTYFVLSLPATQEMEQAVLDTSACGADNCGVGVGSSPPPPSPETTQLLFGIYTSVGIAAVVVLLVLVDDQQVPKESKIAGVNIWVHSRSVFQLMTDSRMALLIPILVFHGLQEAATFGDFTKAYVACSQGVAYIGLVLTSYGVSSSISSLLFGQLEKVTDRIFRITFGFVCHIGLLIWLYLWKPTQGQIWPLLAAAFVWGMCTVFWRAQMACLLGVMFPKQQEQAFSIMVVTQGIGWVFGLMLATFPNLCVGQRLIILAVFLTASFALYLVSEYRYRTKGKPAVEGGITPTREVAPPDRRIAEYSV